MKTYLDCIPCFFKQGLEAARMAHASKSQQKKVLHAIAKALPSFSYASSPPEMGRIIHSLVKKIIKNNDPYAKIKEESNTLALNMYGKLKSKVNRSPDRLLMAIELAIAGNIIDYGAKNSLNVDEEIKKILKQESRIIKHKKKLFNYRAFKRVLKRAKTILYLADNAGETVFDRVLIEEIKKADDTKHIIYAVKEKPTINDALMHDAQVSGIDKIATVISSGADAPGTVLSLCSPQFLKQFKRADMIISKGQGNFEALSNVKREIFFLLMIKCPVIAGDLALKVGQCSVGDTVLFHHG